MRYPIATYRVQLNKDFPFDQATALLPFLQALGISDLYASPVFKARPSSTHGYDVVDSSTVNPELGGPEGFDALAAELSARGMGLLLDIVPNHMAASSDNAWWTDVLENGPSSAYAPFFDVEWDPAKEYGEEKIFLPILGVPYGTALENGEIRLSIGPDGFAIDYHTIHLPVDPSAYETIFEHGPEHRPESAEFRALIDALQRLPGRTAQMWEGIEARRREVPAIKSQLFALFKSDGEVRAFVDGSLTAFNGVKGDPASFDALDTLIARQPYRLAWWHGARERMNYRRFFDVSELIGVRVENPEVFAATHAAILGWVEQGKVTGLRVDHVDGLLAPREYLERLGAMAGSRPYIVVEKILLEDERLPESWPVEGTSGYDFLGVLNGVFIDGGNFERLQDTYSRFTGLSWTFDEAAYEQKRWIVRHLFRGEMFALSLHLELLADSDRHGRDLSPQELRKALAEITACLPVYRTYLEGEQMEERDRECIRRAIGAARAHTPEIGDAVYQFLARVLTADFPRDLSDDGRKAWVRFVMRWQQLTGPVTAKGVEDTTLYVYNRLLSMNEVGARHTAVPLGTFHEFNGHRQRRWPAAMSASSTHDTKRSEDVRARLNVLSELPAEWDRNIFRWSRWNRDKKTQIEGRAIPDRNEEILLYQTLLGVWPLSAGEIPSTIERVKQYIVKATREAKVYSTWIKPNETHERAIHAFLDAIADSRDDNRFLPHFIEFQSRIAFFGALNSLAQVVIKATAPGIPDFYENTALWDLSLVDPDNRRPVDVALRRKLLDDMAGWKPEIAGELLGEWKDGRVKAFVTQRVLGLRSQHPALFLEGEYVPVGVEGMHAESVIAFARTRGDQACVTVAPRFAARLGGAGRFPLGRRAWKDTTLRLHEALDGQRWVNAITGEAVNGNGLAAILSTFPLAVLVPAQ